MTTQNKNPVYKITTVTVKANGKSHTESISLLQNPGGGAILPQAQLDRLLSKLNVRRGDTYSVS